MQKMTVIIDEEKVRNSNEIFPYEEMLKAVDEICEDADLKKVGKHNYVPKEGEDSWGCLLVAISEFKANADWLFKYLKEWTIVDDDGTIEDGISVFREEFSELFR